MLGILCLLQKLDPGKKLENKLIVKNYYEHPDKSKSFSEEEVKHRGLIELPPPTKKEEDTLNNRLLEYFIHEQDYEVEQYVEIEKKGVIAKVKLATPEKTCYLEERKLRISSNNLFINIQRYFGTEYLKEIEIPFRLELNENYFEDNKRTSYELCNFIVFTGNHYVAYVKKGDNWFLCDDKNVAPVDSDTVLAKTKKAYIVHYKKCS